MDSGNLVLLILGIGLLALIAYLIYKNRAIKGNFKVGPISAELESNQTLQAPPKPTPVDPITQSKVGPITVGTNTAAANIIVENAIHPTDAQASAGATQVKASIQQFISPSGNFNSKALRDFIAEHFNLEEMAGLAADIEIDFDSIPGQGKEAKARELVQYCERRSKLALLAAAVIDARG